MLTPVRSSSLAPSSLVHAEPVTGQPQPPEKQTNARLAQNTSAADTLKNKFNKLADLLAGSQNSIANPLIKLAIAVAHSIDLKQFVHENMDDYRQRLIDVLLAMKPDEQAQVEQKSNLKSVGITLPNLAEAMKSNSSPNAAKLIAILEKSASETPMSFEDQASQVYSNSEDGHFEMADSLKYRSAPSQAGILTTQPASQAMRESNLPKQQNLDRAPNQADLVRTFVDELYEVAMSLDAEVGTDETIELNAKSPISEQTNIRSAQTNNDVKAGKGTSAGNTTSNRLLMSTDSVAVAKAEVQSPKNGEHPQEPRSVDVEVTDVLLKFGQMESGSDANELVPPPKAGILEMISERLMRSPILAPKLGDRNLLAVAPSVPLKEQVLQVQKELGSTVETPKRAPMPMHDPAYVAKLTTLFLKDLPTTTLAKLQAIADILIANQHALAADLLSAPSPDHGNSTKKSGPETLEQKMDGNGTVAKDLNNVGRADSLTKEAQSQQLDELLTEDPFKQTELPSPTQGRAPQIAVQQTPLERIAQQMQLFNTLAFTPIPYPIVDEQEPPSSPQRQEKEDENEDPDADNDRSDGQSRRQNQNQQEESTQDNQSTGADNPFAPDIELKRHPSDAERAFHMYQKMGGL